MIDLNTLGRWLMAGGALIFVVGLGLTLSARFGLPLGRLPGDIRIENENFSFYFPLASSIVISLVLTILLNLIGRFWKR